MNTYNARVSFRGEGSFEFVLPNFGEVQIYAGKDIYLKGLTQAGVEALRELRPLLLDHKLNAKPDGCFKVLELVKEEKVNPMVKAAIETKAAVKEESVADLKAELKSGPISAEELNKALEDTKVETKVEEVTNPGDYVLTSTKHKGKKISDLTRGQLAGNMTKFNAEDLAAIEAFKNLNR